MLISFEEIQKALNNYNIKLTGVLHLGAHNCEEMSIYNQFGVKGEDVIWIDALPHQLLHHVNSINNCYPHL